MRSRRRLDRWNNNFGTVCCCGLVDRERVIGCVCGEACNVILNRIEEIESGLRIVGIPVGQDLGDNHTGSINAEIVSNYPTEREGTDP